MKTILKTISFLTLLFVANLAFSQNDLDVVNNTACSYSIRFGNEDFSSCQTCLFSATTATIPASTSVTIGRTIPPFGVCAQTGNVPVVYVLFLTSGTLIGDCGSTSCDACSYPLSTTMRDCNGVTVNVVFTPATSTTNAILTIN